MKNGIKTQILNDFKWPVREPREVDGARCYPRIEVVGPMRVGKTTALKLIEKWLESLDVPVKLYYEDWQHNPYLKASYENPRQAFLKSQKWFIKRKYQQLNEGNCFEGVRLHDQSPEGDLCYPLTRLMLGEMSRAEFDDYWREYQQLDWRRVGKANLLVCLAISDRALLSRQLRKFEDVEGGKYLRAMNKVHRKLRQFLEKNKNVLVVDAGKLNFSLQGEDKKKLLGLVGKKLDEGGGWLGQDRSANR